MSGEHEARLFLLGSFGCGQDTSEQAPETRDRALVRTVSPSANEPPRKFRECVETEQSPAWPTDLARGTAQKSRSSHSSHRSGPRATPNGQQQPVNPSCVTVRLRLVTRFLRATLVVQVGADVCDVGPPRRLRLWLSSVDHRSCRSCRRRITRCLFMAASHARAGRARVPLVGVIF